MTSTSDYLATVAEDLRELGPVVRTMMAGSTPLEPIVLLGTIQSAAIALHDGARTELPADAVEEARAVVAAARRKPGRTLVERVFDALDLGASTRLDAHPDEEPEELESRLHDVFELGFLVDVLTGARRERLVAALDEVAGEVLAAPDAHASLYETAFLLRGVVDLPDDHPVAELIDTVMAATDTLAHLDHTLEPQAVTAMFNEARARFEAALSPLERLVRWVEARWPTLAAALAPTPVRAFAATGPARPAWPASRLVLDRMDDVEITLWPHDQRVDLEVVGRALPDTITVTIDGVELAESTSHDRAQRTWPLPADLDVAALVASVNLDGDARTVRSDAARLVPAPDSTLRDTLSMAAVATPGWTRARLMELARGVERESLALAIDFERQASRIEVPRLPVAIGRASFVVTRDDEGAPGFLVHVAAAGLAHGVPLLRTGVAPDAVARVARWVGALVGAPESLAVDGVDLRIAAPVDVELDGDSWQLAAAIAILSERIGVAPGGLVVSGRLGDGVGEVLPVDHVATKRSTLALEVPADPAPALARVVDHAHDIRPELARLFGHDWDARLRASLGLASDDLARSAVRAWRGWFARRNVADATVDRERALDLAERALASGVTGVHRVEARWVEGACRLHRGESARALEAFAEVDAGLAALPPFTVDAFTREELIAYRGIALVDLARPSEAVALARTALDHLDALRARDPVRVDRRHLDVRLQVAGTLARATAFAGDLTEARRLLRASLDLSVPGERARTLMDLAELERRAGELEVARSLLAEARAALDDIPSRAAAGFTERFLRLYESRADLVPADPGIDAPRWAEWPQPAEVLEALVGGPRAELVAWVTTHALAAPERLSTIHMMVVLTTVLRAWLDDAPGDTQLGSIASELADLLGAREGIEPGLAQALVRVRGGEIEAARTWVRDFPY